MAPHTRRHQKQSNQNKRNPINLYPTRSLKSTRKSTRVIEDPSFWIPRSSLEALPVRPIDVPDGDGFAVWDDRMEKYHFDPEITEMYLKAEEARRQKDIPRCRNLCQTISSYNGLNCTFRLDGCVLRKKVRVRIRAMDAPEKGQFAYVEAGEHLAGLICGQENGQEKRIYSQVFYVDSFKRYICDVYDVRVEPAINIAEQMLQAGYAWVHRGYKAPINYPRLEKAALWAGLGLWADQFRPEEPWKFKELNPEVKAGGAKEEIIAPNRHADLF